MSQSSAPPVLTSAPPAGSLSAPPAGSLSAPPPEHLSAPPPGVTDAPVTDHDHPELARLHDRIFGPGALTRTAYRIREGLASHSPYCRLARDSSDDAGGDGGRLIAFARFTPVSIGDTAPALMLGPVAVDPAFANLGHARRLVRLGVDAARTDGIRAVVLVGDLAYYGRLGFIPAPDVVFPGPADRARILAVPLDGAGPPRGLVRACVKAVRAQQFL